MCTNDSRYDNNDDDGIEDFLAYQHQMERNLELGNALSLQASAAHSDFMPGELDH